MVLLCIFGYIWDLFDSTFVSPLHGSAPDTSDDNIFGARRGAMVETDDKSVYAGRVVANVKETGVEAVYMTATEFGLHFHPSSW